MATQALGIIFNATAIAQGVLSPPFRTAIQQKNAQLQVYDVLQIEATLQEVHSASAEVTEHPVEVGSDITDHIRPKAVEVRIDGFISNTPVQNDIVQSAVRASPLGLGVAAADAAINAMIGGAEFVRDGYNTLRAILDAGQTVLLNTPYRQYENMAMTDLQIPRDPHIGDALRFTATFRQIITVEGATTVTKPALAQGAFDTGTQSTTSAPDAVKKSNSTLLNAMFGKAANQIGLVLPPRQ